MAIKGQIIKDNKGNDVYPVTHVDLVIDSNGQSIRQILESLNVGGGTGGGGSSSSGGSTEGGGGITSESDPVFVSHVAHSITQAMIDSWNAKSNLAIGTTATTAAAGNHNHDGVYLKSYTEQFQGTVKKVNGQSPNASGEVTITIPSSITEADVSGWGFIKGEQYQGTVKSVNNTAPDANGNVSLTIPSEVTDSTVSGWGYLKPVILEANANLDTITDSGFYIAPQGHSIASPGTAGTCFGMIVIRRHPTSANYVTQLVFYGGTDTIIQYERSRSGSTWNSWYNI